MSATKVEKTPIIVDWAEIDDLLTQKKFKLTEYAKSKNFVVNDFRQVVTDHYGDRIVFKRGRTGGVFWATPPVTGGN